MHFKDLVIAPPCANPMCRRDLIAGMPCFSQEVKAASESVEANPAAPMNTPTNLQLVAFLKDISTLWSDVRLSMMVHQLSMVTSAIDRQEAVSTFINAIKQALPKLAVDDASVFKEACGQVVASLPVRDFCQFRKDGQQTWFGNHSYRSLKGLGPTGPYCALWGP